MEDEGEQVEPTSGQLTTKAFWVLTVHWISRSALERNKAASKITARRGVGSLGGETHQAPDVRIGRTDAPRCTNLNSSSVKQDGRTEDEAAGASSSSETEIETEPGARIPRWRKKNV